MTRIILYVMCVLVLAGCTSVAKRFARSPQILNAAGLRWAAPAGGVARYGVNRDGLSLAATGQTSFADNTVSESTHYSYSVYALYRHGATPTLLGQIELDTPAPSATGDDRHSERGRTSFGVAVMRERPLLSNEQRIWWL